LCLFSLAWVALAVSTAVTKIEIERLHPPGVVQLAVPVMGVVGWLVCRELAVVRTRPEPATALPAADKL
jgi:hypothetical protein